MTTRAKRLAKYLESIGWTIESDGVQCMNDASHYVSYRANFCPACGAETEKIGRSPIDELESGIKYALGEVKTLKGG